MTIYFSAERRGFFDTAIHKIIPADAVVIDANTHRELLAAQAEGATIAPGPGGRPVATMWVASADEKMAALRNRRDVLLRESDRTQLPDMPLSDTDRAAWTMYRQQLRDLPASIDNIDQVEWPTPPQQ